MPLRHLVPRTVRRPDRQWRTARRRRQSALIERRPSMRRDTHRTLELRAAQDFECRPEPRSALTRRAPNDATGHRAEPVVARGAVAAVAGIRPRQPAARGHECETIRMVEDLDDLRRHEPSYVLPERDMLERWLEFHRTTLLLKTEGLDDEGRKRRPVSTSLLSLHGLVRHMAEVERNWFRRVLLD